MPPLRLLMVSLICLSGAAYAQTSDWQWIDSNGRKVFSDRPPPPSPPVKIIKRPGELAAPAVTPAAASPGAATPSDTPQEGTSNAPSNDEAKPVAKQAEPAQRTEGVDPELEAKKKAIEAEEARKEQEHAEKVAQAKKENCARARRALAVLQSGQVLSHTNDKGERGYMTDSTRQQELSRTQQAIASDCNG